MPRAHDPRISIEADQLARRFIALVSLARPKMSDPDANYHSREFATVKRASMDLTHALAALRKAPKL